MTKLLEELSRAIEHARADEDRAWSAAAELRRRGVSNSVLLGAIQLVEAATSRRMKLEEELQRAERLGCDTCQDRPSATAAEDRRNA